MSDGCAVVLAARVKFEMPVRTTAKKCRFAGRHTMQRRKICIFFQRNKLWSSGRKIFCPQNGVGGMLRKVDKSPFFLNFISAVVTKRIKSAVLIQLVTFLYQTLPNYTASQLSL